jgi:hypothetical protein
LAMGGEGIMRPNEEKRVRNFGNGGEGSVEEVGEK